MKFTLTVLLLCIAIAASVAGYGYVVHGQFTCWTERGQFGDMFGAINAVFTGLAFAGTLIAVFLQFRQLRQQEEEIRNSARQQFVQTALQSREISFQKIERVARLRARLYVLWRLSHFVDSYIRQSSPPLSNNSVQKFMTDFQLFVNEEMAIMTAFLGVGSKEEEAFRYLDNLFFTAQENNLWMHYEDFTKDFFPSIGALIESTRGRLYSLQLEEQRIVDSIKEKL